MYNVNILLGKFHYSIYGKGLADTREILWPNVAKYFEGVPSVFLCKVFYYLLQEAIQKTGSKNFIRKKRNSQEQFSLALY